MSVLDYSYFDNLDFSSDSDDCHPNIDKDTWKRLKQRKREEEGIVKKEVYLVDKWNTTSVNNRRTNTTEAAQASPPKATSDSKSEESKEARPASEDAPPAAASTSTSEPTSTPDAAPNEELERLALENRASAVAEALDFDARSNPLVFLENNTEQLEKFARLKTKKAEKYLKKNPHLVHEAAEGYLITRAVDLAVEGDDVGKRRVARRCLEIHNLVLSCKQANVKAESGVDMFFRRLAAPQMREEYAREFEKQFNELLVRIEERRRERLEEMQAPIGPGGLDPTEVLNSLPKDMQEAFLNKDTEMLRNVLSAMDPDQAQRHMDRCIASGLWTENAGDAVDDDELAAAQDIPDDLR